MKIKSIPTEGIWGAAALREAAAGSYQAVMDLITTQLRAALTLAEKTDVWPYVVALFPDQVIVTMGGKFTRYDYKMDGDTAVTLSNPVQVIETFRPVADGAMREAQGGAFIEAADDKRGTKWTIRIIRAGLSGNGNYYPDATLREAAPLFDGVRVFIKSDEEHLAGKGKSVRNLIGRISEPRFVEGKTPDTSEIHGTFDVLESAEGVAAKLREAWDRKMTDIFGFSIDAKGDAKAGKVGGRAIRVASKFREVKSVDLIVEPGAGGQVVQLIEALNEDPDMKLRTRMLDTIKAKSPEAYAKLDVETIDDEALEAAYREALKEPEPAKTPAGANPDAATKKDIDEAVRFAEARGYARTAIQAAKLPEAAKARLKKQFGADARFTEAQVDEAIKDEREYLAKFVESGRVADLGDISRVEAGESRQEKVAQMLDAFFDPENKKVISFKECYVEITGDARVTGDAKRCDEVRLREALGSDSFSNVLGDSIARRLVAEYGAPAVYDAWRAIVNVVPVGDFRTQERTRFGGYGDLPAVAQAAPYLELASPDDEKATYAVSKRGGVETVTLEMIKNDDVGVIQRIPVRLARAGKRTLGKFVFDLIRTNPIVYDAVAFFHASHGNLGAAALDATSWAAARLAMMKQTEAGSGDRLGIGPSFVLVPSDLEAAAFDLFRRGTNLDKTFVQSLNPTIIPVWYWTDANDWAAFADPKDIPTIEIGFLDGNEEPELFTQDSPTVGSLFSHDQITYKIRHIYGGNVTDYRGGYKAVVA